MTSSLSPTLVKSDLIQKIVEYLAFGYCLFYHCSYTNIALQIQNSPSTDSE